MSAILASDRAEPRTRIAWRWLLAIACARLLLHLACNGQYGFHRDELAVLSDAKHLDWGYVAYPPLTPLLARLGIALAGDTLFGFRLFAAIAQSVAALAAGLIARELGGRTPAQAGAALALACVPFSVLSGSLLMYAGIDYLWWVLAAWMLLRLVNGGDARWWLGIGLVIGLGMQTRYTMLACVAGIVAAVLATRLRRQLASPWLWAGVAVSLLVFAPNAWWQWRHDFVYLEFVDHIHARDVRIGRTDGFLRGQLLIGASPLLAPLWCAGLAWLAFARRARRWRLLLWLYAVPLLVFALTRARDYYLAPAYPMLLAAGCVWLGGALARLRPRAKAAAWTAVAVVGVAACASTLLIALPAAPIGSAGWRISARFHDNFAEQIGWPELTADVARIYRALPPAERARTAIYANNYGEAGAIERYGTRYGLPPAISGVNSFWYRGYGDAPPLTVIVLGDDDAGISDTPADCRRVGLVRVPHGVENEESSHPNIYLCRNLRFDWAKAWPRMRTFG
jgi:hypothetical protein